MSCWEGRPSHRTSIRDSDTAVRNGVAVRTAHTPHYNTDIDSAVGNVVVVITALTPHYNN